MAPRSLFPRAARTGGLALLVGLAAPGCDLFGRDDLLTAPSSSERDDIADLTGDFFDCDAEVEVLTDSERGTLDRGDCLQTDDSYQDFYVFEVEEDADVRIEMESDDFAPYLFLLSVDLDDNDPIVEIARDTNDSGSDQATIDEDLEPGLYLVYANSVTADGEGDYTLTVEADENDDDDNRAARSARPSGVK